MKISVKQYKIIDKKNAKYNKLFKIHKCSYTVVMMFHKLQQFSWADRAGSIEQKSPILQTILGRNAASKVRQGK